MKILSRDKAWVWFLLLLFSYGTSNIVLGALLDCFEEDAWYRKPVYWIIGFLCFLFPFAIMLSVFYIEISCKVSAKLNVPFKEIYLCPYIWILCLGVPIIGWILFLVMTIYVCVWPIVMIHRGEAEKYMN